MGVGSCGKMNLRLWSEEIVFTKIKPNEAAVLHFHPRRLFEGGGGADGCWDIEAWKQ